MTLDYELVDQFCHFCLCNGLRHFYPIFMRSHSHSSSKVILVTGGSSGLGKAMCQSLAEQGHRVYGTSRKLQHEKKVGNYFLIPMDVTHQTDDHAMSVQKALEWVCFKEGRLDVLVNNAGVSGMGPFEEMSLDEVKVIFETNVFGMIRVTQNALPLLRKSKGLVINISSIAGEIALPYRSAYSASKFAVEALTESLSLELSPFDVRVLLIQPGDLNTEINQNRKVIELKQGSPYEKPFRLNLENLQNEMSQSMDPAVIGDLVVKIMNENKPRLRYRVGRFVQKLSPVIKKFLPDRWFEALLRKYYHLNGP